MFVSGFTKTSSFDSSVSAIKRGVGTVVAKKYIGSHAALGAIGGAATGAVSRDEFGERGGLGGAVKGGIIGGVAGGVAGAGRGVREGMKQRASFEKGLARKAGVAAPKREEYAMARQSVRLGSGPKNLKSDLGALREHHFTNE